MLLFIDESGHDNSGTPCEVLAGVAVAENDLWNLVRAVRAAEREHFGDYLRTFLIEERKAKKLLKTKRFRSANRNVQIDEKDLLRLANAALVKGKEARDNGLDQDSATQAELVAYSRQVLHFVHEVLNIAASFNVQVFASMLDPNAPRPPKGKLRKDYVFLFERYFYFLETLPPRERGAGRIRRARKVASAQPPAADGGVFSRDGGRSIAQRDSLPSRATSGGALSIDSC